MALANSTPYLDALCEADEKSVAIKMVFMTINFYKNRIGSAISK
jgi:hypothetical protein